MKRCISINQKQDKIIIKIAETATEAEIIEDLNSKLKSLKKIYKEEKMPIWVRGKILKNEEIKKVQKIIQGELDVDIDFESPKVLGLHGIKKTFEQQINTSETKYINTSLRSGQKVEFDGSVVVLGDVNGGAEVIASEHIVVLGNLRGLAHAGAKGNKKAIIAANLIESPQLRIADKIKEIEKYEKDFKFAFLKEENVILTQ